MNGYVLLYFAFACIATAANANLLNRYVLKGYIVVRLPSEVDADHLYRCSRHVTGVHLMTLSATSWYGALPSIPMSLTHSTAEINLLSKFAVASSWFIL